MKANKENIEKFKELYEPELSLRKNAAKMKGVLDVCFKTVQLWRDKFLS